MSDTLLNLDNYIDELAEIQNDEVAVMSAEPDTEGYFEINSDTREISIPEKFQSHIAVLYDHNAEVVNFKINRYFDNVDLSEKRCVVLFKLSNGEEGYISPSSLFISESELTISWSITYDVTKLLGKFYFSLCFYSIDTSLEDELIYDYRWNSLPSSLNVVDGLRLESQYSQDLEEPNIYENLMFEIDKKTDNTQVQNIQNVLDEINAILEERLEGDI